MPRRKRRGKRRKLPVCDVCLRPFEPQTRPGPRQTCPGCRAWIAEDERHDRPYAEDTGHRPAWAVDYLTPRQLQRLYGERFVEAANQIIARILDDDGAGSEAAV